MSDSAIITISARGLTTAGRIFREEFQTADVYVSRTVYDKGDLPSIDQDRLYPFEQGVISLTAEIFSRYKNLIYIMPLGVVIRAIAAHVRSKYSDPAVVTADIVGRFAVSTLSGHEGGANALCEKVSRALNAEFVISTSTEAEKDLIIGMGCRKGVSEAEVAAAVNYILTKTGYTIDRVRMIATVDRKKHESGLLAFCNSHSLPLKSISSAEIKESRLRYKRSALVERVLGIGAVAEPCALLAAAKTRLITGKIKCKKVTAALAQENFTW